MKTVKRIILTVVSVALLVAVAAASGNYCGRVYDTGATAPVFNASRTGGEQPETTEPFGAASRTTDAGYITTKTTKTQTTFANAESFLNVSVKYAANAVLYDLDDNVILYRRNINTLIFPASTTKMLTACVALTFLDEDEVIEVGSEIKMIGKDSSTCGLKVGYRLKVSDLIYGLMIPSGNDAAYTLAVNVARKLTGNAGMSNEEAVKFFSALMNYYAKQLGATHSHFVNPDGYHDYRHYTTVSDLLLITKKAMSFPLVREAGAAAKAEIKIASGQTLKLENTNYMIQTENKYYYPEVNGFKTGYTVRAGYCLVATAEIDGKTYIAIVMGCSRNDRRFVDAKSLFDAVKKY